jgi:hypothetical protein
MWLPVELPIDLKDAGVPVESPEPGLAWSAAAALAIVEALLHTTVAIVSCEVFRSDRVGLVPIYEGWSIERRMGETASDFAARSRTVARDRIEARMRSGPETPFFAMTFSGQQDAA